MQNVDALPLNRTVLRRCLTNLDAPAVLGTCSVARMVFVDVVLRTQHRSDTPLERGRILQRILREAMAGLKPEQPVERPANPAWRLYLALHMLYGLGRHRDYVAQFLNVSTAALYRIVGDAVDQVIAELLRMDLAATDEAKHSAPAPEPATQPERVPTVPVPSVRTLIGRERECALILARIRNGGADGLRAHGIYGLPGVGKTELLKQIVHDPEVKQAFDIVLWAGLGRRPDLAALLNTWARALGVSQHVSNTAASVTELSRLLYGAAAGLKLLIVLDDVWSSTDALPLRIGCAGSTFLFSTRLPEVAVALAGKHTLHLHELAPINAMALLHDFAPEVLHAHPEQFHQLSDALGGLPLAIVLAGQYLQEAVYLGQARRVEQALLRLQQTLFRQTLQDRSAIVDGIDPSERTLAAVITQTLSVLSNDARCALPAIATLLHKPYSFSEEAVLMVAGVSTDVCDELVNYGILEVSGPNRYAMHQMIADYLREHETGPQHWEAMIHHYVASVECEVRTFHQLKADEVNLLDACARAQRVGHAEFQTRLILGLLPYLAGVAMWQTALPYLESMIDSEFARARPETRGELLLGAAQCRLMLGDAAAADALAEAVVAGAAWIEPDPAARARERRDALVCRAQDIKARAALLQGDFHGAVAFGRSALLVATRLGAGECCVNAQLTLAAGLAGCGDHESAERLIAQSDTMPCDPKRAYDVDTRLSQALLRLGYAQYLDGRLDRALQSITRAKNVAERAELANLCVTCDVIAALIRYANGELAAAEAFARDALDVDTNCAHAQADKAMAHVLIGVLSLSTSGPGDLADTAFQRAVAHIGESANGAGFFPASAVLAWIAQARITAGQNELARLLLDRALSLAGRPIDLVAAHTQRAILEARCGRIVEAFDMLNRAQLALGQCAQQGSMASSPLLARECAYAEGVCWLEAGDLCRAEHAFHEAHKHACRHGGLPGIATIAFQLADLALRRGSTDDAVTHVRLAHDLFGQMGHLEAQRAADLLAYLSV
jgi:tetratricopeptide (TPR) repeat protein